MMSATKLTTATIKKSTHVNRTNRLFRGVYGSAASESVFVFDILCPSLHDSVIAHASCHKICDYEHGEINQALKKSDGGRESIIH